MDSEIVSPFSLLSQLADAKLPSEDALLAALCHSPGYYETPLDTEGKPLGPLVGYSGRYEDETTGRELQYVGFRYFNLAQLEQYPPWTEFFAHYLAIAAFSGYLWPLDYVVGVPEGGLIIGNITARHLVLVRYAGLQKRVVALTTGTSKERTELALGRHDIESGARVVLCEDVVNNFSTTDKAIEVVQAAGAQVVGIVCVLNRSDRTEYKGLSVVSLIHLPTPQFRQDDPRVAPYLENPGVVWDVKSNWPLLMQAMAGHAA